MIVLDTHALVWWVNGDASLSKTAYRQIEETLAQGDKVLISAISLWEIAMQVERGRVALAMNLEEWLAAVESVEGVVLVSVTPQLAIRSVGLPGEFHKDPADRMIVALAREQNVPMVTADLKIQRYPHVRWIW